MAKSLHKPPKANSTKQLNRAYRTFIDQHPQWSSQKIAEEIFPTTPLDELQDFIILIEKCKSGKQENEMLTTEEELQRKRALNDLKKQSFFSQIRRQYKKKELVYFQKIYVELYLNFERGITYPDRSHIKDIISAEIEINRCKESQKHCMIDQDRWRTLINKDMASKSPDPNKIIEWEENVKNLEERIIKIGSKITEQEKTKTTRYASLNADRSQRIKDRTDPSKTFHDLIKELDNYKVRQQEGHLMGLIDLSVENEKKRLQQAIDYGNSQYDSPLLNYETVEQVSQEAQDVDVDE